MCQFKAECWWNDVFKGTQGFESLKPAESETYFSQDGKVGQKEAHTHKHSQKSTYLSKVELIHT